MLLYIPPLYTVEDVQFDNTFSFLNVPRIDSDLVAPLIVHWTKLRPLLV